jgi:hypothetical protein
LFNRWTSYYESFTDFMFRMINSETWAFTSYLIITSNSLLVAGPDLQTCGSWVRRWEPLSVTSNLGYDSSFFFLFLFLTTKIIN